MDFPFRADPNSKTNNHTWQEKILRSRQPLFAIIVNQPVYLKSFVAHSFTVCHAVLGEDREFDDKAAANWLKYAAMLRPSAK